MVLEAVERQKGMNKKQLMIVCGVLVYIAICLIANQILEKELAMQAGQLWTELPTVLRFKLQSVRNMRFLFLPMLIVAGFLFYALREVKIKIVESKEGRKLRVKRFILREAIILIFGLIISVFGFLFSIKMCDSINYIRDYPLFAYIFFWSEVLLAFNYLIYLLIRFVLWLIKDAKLRSNLNNSTLS
jgi:hypothetical protein